MNEIDPKWIKDYGLIKARQSGAGDGNLPLYTAITLCLYHTRIGYNAELLKWSERLESVFELHEIKPGLLRRTPTDQGQETWDNLLGWTALSLVLEQRHLTKRIVNYGFTHFFSFDTDGKPGKEDYILNPHLWALAIPVAYPLLEAPIRPIQKLVARKLNADHPGGIMLDWLWFYSISLLGLKHEKLTELNRKLPEALKNQLDFDHPAIVLSEALEWTKN